jgi:uncharacterized protein
VLDKTKLARFGLGLGLRRSLLKETLAYAQTSDSLVKWLEIVPENYISLGGFKVKQFQSVLDSKVALIPHSINLSIGTAPEILGHPVYDRYLLDEMKELFAEIDPPWFSDHLSCTRINGLYLQNLIPVPFTEETVVVISDNVKFLQDEFQLPFLIENPSYYSTLLKPELREAEFINKILSRADCGLLLDVNNIYVNSINHNFYQAEEFLDSLDLNRVVQVHIAGHHEGFRAEETGKFLPVLDTHGNSIRQEVYDILDKLLLRTEVNAILLERDSNFPDFNDLIDELKSIQSIMDKYQLVSR